MSFLDPRSNSCPFCDLWDKHHGYGCQYYHTDLYDGFLKACIHPDAKGGQKTCPNGYSKKEESDG